MVKINPKTAKVYTFQGQFKTQEDEEAGICSEEISYSVPVAICNNTGYVFVTTVTMYHESNPVCYIKNTRNGRIWFRKFLDDY